MTRDFCISLSPLLFVRNLILSQKPKIDNLFTLKNTLLTKASTLLS